MGAFSFSIDKDLLDMLSTSGQFQNFVETGTYLGETALSASKLFEKVWTVEASEELFLLAKKRLGATSNIVVELSDSPKWLRQIRKKSLKGNTIFWLDAHWCSAESTTGANSQCPLLLELDAIETLGAKDLILIDDARLFTAKPAPPHESSQWPTLKEILERILHLSELHEIQIVNDVIMVFPASLKEVIINYTIAHGSDLVELIWKAKEYDLIAERYAQRRKSLFFRVHNGLKRIGQGILERL